MIIEEYMRMLKLWDADRDHERLFGILSQLMSEVTTLRSEMDDALRWIEQLENPNVDSD